MSTPVFRRLRAVAVVGLAASLLSALPASATISGGTASTSSASDGATSTTTVTTSQAVAPTTVVPARTLVDSVGVGVHLRETRLPYGNFAAVKQALVNLGVRHIRDGIGWNGSRFLELSRSGIKTLASVPRAADTDAELAQALRNAEGYRSALSSIGGPNEYETTVTDWVTKLRSFQRRIFERVNADPDLRNLPVLAPSLRTATKEELLGDLSAWLDLGAVHGYPMGKLPEQIVPGYMREAAVTSGNKPIVITETGMSNGTDAQRRQYGMSYSDRAAGIYTPRLILEYFRMGARRTYIYELVNRNQQAGMANREGFFGLLNADFTPKPAYNSVRTLLRTLTDTGPQFTARQRTFGLRSGTALRRLTFQKSDGTYYIALWNPVSVWSGGSGGHELYPDPVPATLDLPFTARAIEVIDLQRGMQPVRTIRGTARAALSVGASVQLVKVTP